MSTYLIQEPFTITRQAGDISDVVFVLQNTLSLSGKTVKFQVRSSRGVLIIDKVSPTNITVLSQTITIPLLAADTYGYKGTYSWELEISASTTFKSTIGFGDFIIIKTTIP
jgi:hypothetical protein